MKKRNMKNTTSKIVNFIQETFKEKGFTKAIIGISGGIDSAVVVKLLVLTLGKDNVIALSLPYGVQKDINDIKLVADYLGIPLEELNIKTAVNTLMDTLNYQSIISGPFGIGVGNLKARTRMIMLYDLSAYNNALVVGTSNRTELELGYFTHYGDGACALEPIGHLYKTEVFQLAKHLKIPEVIISKAPSAGLWDAQTDEEELGYTYDEIDRTLDIINIYNVKKGQGIGTTKQFLNIMRRIEKNKFKSELPKRIKEI